MVDIQSGESSHDYYDYDDLVHDLAFDYDMVEDEDFAFDGA